MGPGPLEPISPLCRSGHLLTVSGQHLCSLRIGHLERARLEASPGRILPDRKVKNVPRQADESCMRQPDLLCTTPCAEAPSEGRS
jgi:hypothetical protein